MIQVATAVRHICPALGFATAGLFALAVYWYVGRSIMLARTRATGRRRR